MVEKGPPLGVTDHPVWPAILGVGARTRGGVLGPQGHDAGETERLQVDEEHLERDVRVLVNRQVDHEDVHDVGRENAAQVEIVGHTGGRGLRGIGSAAHQVPDGVVEQDRAAPIGVGGSVPSRRDLVRSDRQGKDVDDLDGSNARPIRTPFDAVGVGRRSIARRDDDEQGGGDRGDSRKCGRSRHAVHRGAPSP